MKQKGYTHCKGSTIVYQKYTKHNLVKYVCPMCNYKTVRLHINIFNLNSLPYECSYCKNRFEINNLKNK